MNILDLLTPRQRENGEKYAFDKGETLFQEGDVCSGVAFIQRGKIKIASYTLEGREVVYNQLREGDVFGNNLAFSNEPFYRGSVIGQTEGEIVYFPKGELMQLFTQNGAFLEEYLRIQSDFGKSLNLKIKLLGFANAEERFEYYLQTKQGIFRYRSISALAEELFLTRETLSRLLHRMKKDGKIVWEGKTIQMKH